MLPGPWVVVSTIYFQNPYLTTVLFDIFKGVEPNQLDQFSLILQVVCFKGFSFPFFFFRGIVGEVIQFDKHIALKWVETIWLKGFYNLRRFKSLTFPGLTSLLAHFATLLTFDWDIVEQNIARPFFKIRLLVFQ